MNFTKNNSVVNNGVPTQSAVVEDEGMEMTRNHSLIRYNLSAPDEAMELTRNHSVINNLEIACNAGSEEALREEVCAKHEPQPNCEEFTMDITTNHSHALKRLAATPTSVPQSPMDFTRNHSVIQLKAASEGQSVSISQPFGNAATPRAHLDSVDFKRIAKSLQSPNPLNLSQETIQLTNEVQRILSGFSDSKTGELTKNMEQQFGRILAGSSIEKTVDLPTRAKMSRLTIDMADIFENILKSADSEESSRHDDISREGSKSATPRSVSMESPMQVVKVSTPAHKPRDASLASLSSSELSSSFASSHNSFLMSPIDAQRVQAASATVSGSSSPLQHAYQEVTKDVKSKSHRRRSSIGGFVKPIEANQTNITSADSAAAHAPHMHKMEKSVFCFKDFLQVTGTKTRLESSKASRRDSEIGLQGGVGSDLSWPPEQGDLAAMLRVAAIEKVSADDYAQMCLLLLDTNTDSKSVNAQMEDLLDYNPPPIFAKLQALAPHELANVQKDVSELVRRCQFEACCAWDQYRLQFAQATMATLEHNLSQLRSDANLLREATTTIQKLVTQEKSCGDPRVLALQAEVQRHCVEIERLDNKSNSRLLELRGAQAELVALTSSMEQAANKMEIIAVQNAASTEKEAKMKQTQDDYKVLMHSLGCKALCFTKEHVKLLFFDKFTLDLNLSANADQVLIRSVLLTARAATPQRGQFHRATALAQFEQLQVRTLQPLLERVARDCTAEAELPSLVSWLKVRLGRAMDLSDELVELGKRFNLSLVPTECTSESIVSISHRSAAGITQVVLRVNLLKQYPYGPILRSSETDSIVVLSTAAQMVTRADIQRVAEGCKFGPQLLTRMCEAIHARLTR